MHLGKLYYFINHLGQDLVLYGSRRGHGGLGLNGLGGATGGAFGPRFFGLLEGGWRLFHGQKPRDPPKNGWFIKENPIKVIEHG